MHDQTSFVGIELPPAAREGLSSLLKGLSRTAQDRSLALSIVPKAHLHLTLADLGERPAAVREAAQLALSRAVRSHRPMTVSFGRLGVSPARSETAVLWIELRDESGALAALQASVQAELERYGFPSAGPWIPRIALARVGTDFPLNLDRPRIQDLKISRVALYGAAAAPRGRERIFRPLWTMKLPRATPPTVSDDDRQARAAITLELDERLANRRQPTRRQRRDRLVVAGDLEE